MWEDEHVDFDVVVGLAYRGILFASAIAGGKKVAILQADGNVYGPALKGQRVILVDDVIVEGATIRKSMAQVEALGAKVVALACVIDRSTKSSTRELGCPLISAFRTVLE
jgi:orotate phosphoribosyltransferase